MGEERSTEESLLRALNALVCSVPGVREKKQLITFGIFVQSFPLLTHALAAAFPGRPPVGWVERSDTHHWWVERSDTHHRRA